MPRQITATSLAILREQVENEGPSSIAAILIEAVTGGHGVLKSPKGYLKGPFKLPRMIVSMLTRGG